MYGVCSWGRRLCPAAVACLQPVVTKSSSVQGQVDAKHYSPRVSLPLQPVTNFDRVSPGESQD